MRYQVEATSLLAAPPLQGGALVRFPVHRVRSLTGTVAVRLRGAVLLPSYGQLTVAAPGKPSVSPLGKDGAFYFDDLPDGRWPAVIEFEKGTCSFELSVTASDAAVLRLGALECAMEAAR